MTHFSYALDERIRFELRLQRRTIDAELVSTVAEELQFQPASDGERVGTQELTAALVR